MPKDILTEEQKNRLKAKLKLEYQSYIDEVLLEKEWLLDINPVFAQLLIKQAEREAGVSLSLPTTKALSVMCELSPPINFLLNHLKLPSAASSKFSEKDS